MIYTFPIKKTPKTQVSQFTSSLPSFILFYFCCKLLISHLSLTLLFSHPPNPSSHSSLPTMSLSSSPLLSSPLRDLSTKKELEQLHTRKDELQPPTLLSDDEDSKWWTPTKGSAIESSWFVSNIAFLTSWFYAYWTQIITYIGRFNG